MNAPSRRGVLAGAARLGLAVQFLGAPAFAAADAAHGRRKLIVVICRGAMDGLSVAPPVGDADYRALRGPIALDEEALALDGAFALHPALAATHALVKAGDGRIVPAVATPDRARSHFEAQDVLETGAARVYATSSGWLNRTVEALHGPQAVTAISVGTTAPLILRGKAEAASWSPGKTLPAEARLPTLLQDLYKNDPLLSRALASGLSTEAMAQAAMTNLPTDANTPPGADPKAAARKLGATLAGFMREDHGPQIAALSLDGFDTHANQGAATGQLATRLSYLDAVVDGVHAGLGDGWRDTVLIVCTEFGRTARVNGTGGTDHGTASTALLLGGALKAGGIVGDWPTLRQAALYENRDLAPTLDMRGLFKGVLSEHMGVPRSALETSIFPDSADARPVGGLIRT